MSATKGAAGCLPQADKRLWSGADIQEAAAETTCCCLGRAGQGMVHRLQPHLLRMTHQKGFTQGLSSSSSQEAACHSANYR